MDFHSARSTFASILAFTLVSAIGLPCVLAEEDSAGFQCTLSAVTCGSGVTTATETEICGVVELAEVGKLPDKSYTQVSVFAGYRLGSEVLVIGGASAKAGILISCKVPWDAKKKAPDYARLKKELPDLLKAHPTIKEQFPKLDKIELDPKFSLSKLKSSEAKAIKEVYGPPAPK